MKNIELRVTASLRFWRRINTFQMKGKKMELRDFATKQQENVNVKMDYVSMV